jgi:recombination protein RecT
MSDYVRPSALPEIRMQLDAMAAQFAAVLPKHIPPNKFVRVVITAIQNNPDLLEVDRRSLFNACMRAATDGLLPDGRLGAIVIYKDKKRGIKTAQWLAMIAGLRQKVRNSGEIATWDAHVVHERDHWEYEEGDNPHIYHKPVRGDRGPVVAAYSIARLRSGELSREWMWIEDLDKARAVSSASSGPWQQWPEEMYRKTVAKRHAKVLPMSTDIEGLLDDGEPPPAAMIKPDEDNGRIATMVEALDRISGKGGDDRSAVAVPAAAANAPPDSFPGDIDMRTGEEIDRERGNEFIDQGEYAPGDDELPLEKDARHAAEGR